MLSRVFTHNMDDTRDTFELSKNFVELFITVDLQKKRSQDKLLVLMLQRKVENIDIQVRDDVRDIPDKTNTVHRLHENSNAVLLRATLTRDPLRVEDTGRI